MQAKYAKEIKTPFRSCEFVRTNGYKMNDLHWHTYYEILFIRAAGKYAVFNSGNVHEGEAPQIYIHRPYSPHKIFIQTGTPYERYITYVYRGTLRNIGDILDLSVFEKACMLVITPTPEEVGWYDKKCLELISADKEGERTETALLTALIFNRLLKSVGTDRCEIVPSRFEYIQDVLQHIDENLAEPLTIEKLCAKFGVGHTKLLADFRDATGTTYKKFLTDLRMTHAYELLQSGSSIINAALETGYSSEAHFIATYRSYWGITPGESLKVRSNSEK